MCDAQANYAFFNPMRTLIASGIVTVGTIFAIKGGEAHLSLFQRLFHTRVLGQASVLGLLVGTMAFHEYMDRRGPFLEEWETEVSEGWAQEQESVVALVGWLASLGNAVLRPKAVACIG